MQEQDPCTEIHARNELADAMNRLYVESLREGLEELEASLPPPPLRRREPMELAKGYMNVYLLKLSILMILMLLGLS